MHFLILAGPTASGKSELALELAERVKGEVINADSMQVYRALKILTARPSEPPPLPHHLYGILEAHEKGSVAWWLRVAQSAIENCLQRGRSPIVVGGTGLYLKALREGLSPFPALSPSTRAYVRDQVESLGPRFSDYVYDLDPLVRTTIRPFDTQRLARALEVMIQTGQSIQKWYRSKDLIHPRPWQCFVLNPDRRDLYQRINQRVHKMIEEGAVQEVQKLLSSNIDADSPIMKAVGVPELASFIRGEITQEQAILTAQQKTRNYAKRQYTWFRHQLLDKIVVAQPTLREILSKIYPSP